MPEMSGLQLLYWIRDDERFKTLPVVVFSGDEDIEAEVRAQNAGFVAKGDGEVNRILVEEVAKFM